MKFSIEKDQILEALQKVQSIVGQRTTLLHLDRGDGTTYEVAVTLR